MYVPIKLSLHKDMKDQMLFDHDRQPRTNPIRHNWQKVLENAVEVVSSGNGACKLDEHDEDTPRPARHGFGVSAKCLDAQSCYIGAWCVVLDRTERENDHAETAEASEAVETG